jgi:hypothetical protein
MSAATHDTELRLEEDNYDFDVAILVAYIFVTHIKHNNNTTCVHNSHKLLMAESTELQKDKFLEHTPH